MSDILLKTLLKKYLAGELNHAEKGMLSDMLQSPEHQPELESLIDEGFADPALREAGDPETLELIYQQIGLQKDALNDEKEETPVIELPGTRRKGNFRVAAAAIILLVLGTGGYIWLHRSSKDLATTNIAPPVKNDIAPGGNKAILTLSGGQQIILDSAHKGNLTVQGNARVSKTDSGQLTYQSMGNSTGSGLVYNTLATPRGGQYQLTLPDGTQVWLNAASSLIYPTAFSGNERTVQLTGEAYFEVTHDKKRPFKVKVGGQVIEDIGTHFNVNAYTDELIQTTTLLEGAVRIGGHILKPGEKASVAASGTVHVSKGDPEQAIAWKNGLFDFTDNDLPTVMRQLARWYNVDIKYEGKIPERQFTGMIGRSLTLTQVLKGLAREGVQYRIEEGNHLIITP